VSRYSSGGKAVQVFSYQAYQSFRSLHPVLGYFYIKDTSAPSFFYGKTNFFIVLTKLFGCKGTEILPVTSTFYCKTAQGIGYKLKFCIWNRFVEFTHEFLSYNTPLQHNYCSSLSKSSFVISTTVVRLLSDCCTIAVRLLYDCCTYIEWTTDVYQTHSNRIWIFAKLSYFPASGQLTHFIAW